MPEIYFRTGQAAKQLGVSSYHIRRLCETGTIDAEITDGQQWKIPAAEIARLKKDLFEQFEESERLAAVVREQLGRVS